MNSCVTTMQLTIVSVSTCNGQHTMSLPDMQKAAGDSFISALIELDSMTQLTRKTRVALAMQPFFVTWLRAKKLRLAVERAGA